VDFFGFSPFGETTFGHPQRTTRGSFIILTHTVWNTTRQIN